MSSGSSPSILRAWTRSSSLLFNSMIEANRAAVATLGVPTVGSTPEKDQIEPDSVLDEWDVERSLQQDESLSVGDSVQFSKPLSADDVDQFAAVSGDTNPIHLDAEQAEQTRFGGRIVHGALLSGLISAALAHLPGNIIYLSQETQFLRPVSVGDRATASVEIVEAFEENRYRLRTQLLDADDEIAIEGEATILIDDSND
ncbi:MaoC family dehydratase [Halocatena pleomorpha]|uniref:MaoC family dehydratase n=1 Tax=Halocatena pleomorpha TaxID=1785090 RepID=A0A3P3RCF7_9EURY|nr:MaoC family dehydratase [Halocatena pleomorpha]RRJ31172.1 MaoC family dehydratase [Halocatena pleomorpha]